MTMTTKTLRPEQVVGRLEFTGEIDAAMGRVLWSVGRMTDDRAQAMRELVESVARVLDAAHDHAVLPALGCAAEEAMEDRTRAATGPRH